MDQNQKKILLVEDDQGLANVYMMRLQAEGFNTLHVPNGEDAISKTLEYKPDLIILDVMMPKISGFDVLDILRNTPETANVRIIMLTALSQESDLKKARDMGADDYLVKSQVVIADVVDRVKYHLGMIGVMPSPPSEEVNEPAPLPVVPVPEPGQGPRVASQADDDGGDVQDDHIDDSNQLTTDQNQPDQPQVQDASDQTQMNNGTTDTETSEREMSSQDDNQSDDDSMNAL